MQSSKMEGILMKCPECEYELTEEESSKDDCWVGCEDCGEHPAVKCPKCEYFIDCIYYG